MQRHDTSVWAAGGLPVASSADFWVLPGLLFPFFRTRILFAAHPFFKDIPPVALAAIPSSTARPPLGTGAMPSQRAALPGEWATSPLGVETPPLPIGALLLGMAVPPFLPATLPLVFGTLPIALAMPPMETGALTMRKKQQFSAVLAPLARIAQPFPVKVEWSPRGMETPEAPKVGGFLSEQTTIQ